MNKLALVIALALIDGALIALMISDPLSVTWAHWVGLVVTWAPLVAIAFHLQDELNATR